MRPPRSPLPAATLLLAGAVTTTSAVPQSTALARLSFVEPSAQISSKADNWRPVVEGVELATGQAVRVEGNGVARVELPWMTLTLTSGACLRFPDGLLLAAVLESGRMQVDSQENDVMRLVAGPAQVHGHGRLVIRRERQATIVSCLAGRFYVSSVAGVVSLLAGQGTRVRFGRPPVAPTATPAPPDGLWPGADPVYQAADEPVDFRWNGTSSHYGFEVLPIDSEVVLFHRDLDRPAVRLAIPWAGAFRWRVSARDDNGVEGAPSIEGLIAIE